MEALRHKLLETRNCCAGRLEPPSSEKDSYIRVRDSVIFVARSRIEVKSVPSCGDTHARVVR